MKGAALAIKDRRALRIVGSQLLQMHLSAVMGSGQIFMDWRQSISPGPTRI